MTSGPYDRQCLGQGAAPPLSDHGKPFPNRSVDIAFSDSYPSLYIPW